METDGSNMGETNIPFDLAKLDGRKRRVGEGVGDRMRVRVAIVVEALQGLSIPARMFLSPATSTTSNCDWTVHSNL
jgi:hypothetical protein